MGRQLLYLMSLSIVAVLGIAPAAFAQTKPLSCADFVTQEAAQKAYDQGIGNPSRLDPDADGEACESNERLVEMAADSDFGAWAQAIAALAAILALGAIFYQVRLEGLRHSADLILQRRDRYFSEEGRKSRQDAANSIKDSSNDSAKLQEKIESSYPPPEAQLLDFFNRLGLLVQRRVLDKRMVESAFYNSIHRYCWAAKDYIVAKQSGGSTTWVELSYLHREIHFLHMSSSAPWGLRWAIRLWWKVWRVDRDDIPRFPWFLRWAICLWCKVRPRKYFHGAVNNEAPYANNRREQQRTSEERLAEEKTPKEKLEEWLESEISKLNEEKPEDKTLSTLREVIERERERADREHEKAKRLEKELEDIKKSRTDADETRSGPGNERDAR